MTSSPSSQTSSSQNPSANVIRSLLQHAHVLSVYAKNMPYPLKAEITELDLNTGLLALERETYSLSNIPAKLLKTDSMMYRLECQLPNRYSSRKTVGLYASPLSSACRLVLAWRFTCMSSTYQAGCVISR